MFRELLTPLELGDRSPERWANFRKIPSGPNPGITSDGDRSNLVQMYSDLPIRLCEFIHTSASLKWTLYCLRIRSRPFLMAIICILKHPVAEKRFLVVYQLKILFERRFHLCLHSADAQNLKVLEQNQSQKPSKIHFGSKIHNYHH